MIIDSEKVLVNILTTDYDSYDAIVVEGYEGVGKGKLLNTLSDVYKVTPYRPDYNLWSKHDIRNTDRWKISGFFWDIYSHFGIKSKNILLFDRGVISGAVYYNDLSIAKDYKELLRSMRVLHILVTCDKEDYAKFLCSRSDRTDTDIDHEYDMYRIYTERYKECFEEAGVEYIIYKNKFDKYLNEQFSITCEGCGHYSYGYCRHPAYNCKVDKGSSRCNFYSDNEIQDREENR